MDKLRALQYFVAAAEEGTLSGAAGRLHVSVAAVSKLVAALERGLGVALFERTSAGLALTAEGRRYLGETAPLLEQLAAADEGVANHGRASGTLVVGAPEFVLDYCIGPALPRFHARYPEIELDFRIVSRVTDTHAESVDLFLLFGWHEAPDFVQKRIAETSYHVVAAPSYWARHGTPREPDELRGHQCLCFRNPEGTLLDLWVFEKGSQVVEVPVRGWLASAHRNALALSAIEGLGVLRITGVTGWHYVLAGRLVPALEDWNLRHAPPVNVLFRPSQRRKAAVRAFSDFAHEVFRELQAARDLPVPALARERPDWQGRKVTRASRLARGSR